MYLRDIVESPAFQENESLLSLVMGVDIMGHPEVAELGRMPHLLIAGATGAGKSVGLNAMIMSILFKARPDQVRFLMIDPKRIELSPYNDLPHLLYPVISDPKEANQALKYAVSDMEMRYRLLAEKGARNIEAYNRKILKEQALKPAPPPPGEETGGENGAEPIEPPGAARAPALSGHRHRRAGRPDDDFGPGGRGVHHPAGPDGPRRRHPPHSGHPAALGSTS